TSQQLQPATCGSLGLDLAAAVETDLLTSKPYKIPTGIHGPLQIHGQTMGGLIIGRSSAAILGLFVEPGIIDADCCGKIMIIAHTSYPPVTVPKGQRIAQLIPLPQMTKGLEPMSQVPRTPEGFGSRGGLALLTLDLNTRPKKSCRLIHQGHSIVLKGLLDTGADTSVIDPGYWPASWPTQPAATTVSGIGGMTLASRTPVLTVEIEGRQASAALSITTFAENAEC
ncbi:POK9 protein, partial [Vidua chalybeata]|nr:POK9 protein [Vidua chalybeata]